MSQHIPNKRRLWLDCLDQDVLTHIASHLSADPNSSSALSLAETSPIQSKAVLNSLSHTLRFTHFTPDHASRWTRIARHSIQTLSFFDHRFIPSPQNFCTIPFPHNPLSLMHAPSLRRVEIFDETPMLEALRGSPTVNELLVILQGRAPTNIIASVITSLRLCKLEIHCNDMAHSCHSARLCAYDISSFNVRSLVTVCHSPHHYDVLTSYIPKFPNLEEVTVTNQCPSSDDNETELYNSLHKMNSVRIKDAIHSFDLACKLGHRVTCLHIALHRPLTTAQLNQLHPCSAIQDLSIQVEHGAEHALHSFLGCLQNLAALELCFAKPRSLYKQHRGSVTPTLHVNEEALISALSASNTPKLRQLQFVDSVISVGGITKILRSMGCRLTLFTVPVLYQSERPLERLALVLQSLIAHCPNIKSFSCREYPMAVDMDKLGSNVKAETRLVQSLLNKLRRRVPMVCCEFFVKAIESLGSDPYGEPFVTPMHSQDVDSENAEDPFAVDSWMGPVWSLTDENI